VVVGDLFSMSVLFAVLSLVMDVFMHFVQRVVFMGALMLVGLTFIM